MCRRSRSLRASWRTFRALPGPLQAGAWLALWIALLALWPLPAHADSEARRGADWVRVTALACTDTAVLALLQAAGQDPDDWRAASAEFGGAPYAACWRPAGRVAFVVYADGDMGEIPLSELKPVRGA